MKNYADSDYALNKFSKGIVYRFADGIIEITLGDYLAENPEKTKSDFLKLKELSDSIYYEQVKKEDSQTKRNISLDVLLENSVLQLVSSAEAVFFEAIDMMEDLERQEKLLEVAESALESLTKVQRRRYFMFHVEGKSISEIAEAEDVNYNSIRESLSASDKKIKKFLLFAKKHPQKTH